MTKKVKKVTADSNRALSKYLEEIGKFNPLTPDEEIDLAQKLHAGDRAALKKTHRIKSTFRCQCCQRLPGTGSTSN